jgi:hypothetical protein
MAHGTMQCSSPISAFPVQSSPVSCGGVCCCWQLISECFLLRQGGARTGGTCACNLGRGQDLSACRLPSTCPTSWRAAYEVVVISVSSFVCSLFLFVCGVCLVTLESELDFVLSSLNEKRALHIFKKNCYSVLREAVSVISPRPPPRWRRRRRGDGTSRHGGVGKPEAVDRQGVSRR